MKKYKKILIVTHQYLPHVSPRTTRWKLLVDELIDNGHNVSILTGMYPDFDTSNVEIIYFPYTKTTSSTLINKTLENLRNHKP